MYKRASLNQKFSKGHFKLASSIMTKHAGGFMNSLPLGAFAGDAVSGANSQGLSNAIEGLLGKGPSGPLEGIGAQRFGEMINKDFDIAESLQSGLASARDADEIARLSTSVPNLQLGELFSTMANPRDLGLSAGVAGLAGLGGAKMLNNIKALQRKDPSFFGKLMGKKPTGFTRGQLNAMGSALGLGAGAGIYGAGIRSPHVLEALYSAPGRASKALNEGLAYVSPEHQAAMAELAQTGM